jgi:peptide/nickel transport system substrate-binding protein
MYRARTVRRAAGTTAAVAAAALALTACSGNGSGTSTSGSDDVITLGTTDTIITIDPAGEYDNGSFAVVNQVYPFLLNSPYGSPDVAPDIAESAEFTSPTEYTVTLKPDLTFANGHDLTSSDVKFSIDRIVTIADENGPSSLLANLDSVATPDDTTVVFTLKAPDQTFPQILSSPAGPIVDEEVFPADALMDDSDIVAAQPFAGQYVIDTYKKNDLVTYTANPDYAGLLGAAKNGEVDVTYYADASNLKLDVQQGNVDVAYRSLTATDIESLRADDNVQVVDGPGGEIRYIVFNFDTMPFGATTPEADAAKALAVRQAVADLIDREAIAAQVFKNTFSPLYSYVPDGLTGANTSLKSLYGDQQGGPSVDAATARLEAAGITTPVALSLQYTPEHYGPSSADEYALIKEQLESSGLFTVSLQSTEWQQYAKDRTADVYPAYQLGWFPDFSDADNYLTPFFPGGGFLKNHYDNPTVDDLIAQEVAEQDAAARTELIGQVQDVLAGDLSTLPMLQGSQVAVAGTDIDGVGDTLDASFKFRYAALSHS